MNLLKPNEKGSGLNRCYALLSLKSLYNLGGRNSTYAMSFSAIMVITALSFIPIEEHLEGVGGGSFDVGVDEAFGLFVGPNDSQITGAGIDTIGGKVFNDPDANGQDDGDGGFEMVRVQIFECNSGGAGQLIETVFTDSEGEYFFTGGIIDGTTRYRVEFSNIPEGYTSSVFGDDNGTETQFVTGYSCDIDYGIINPNQYCQENPFMVTPCYVSSLSDNEDVLIRFSYANEGTAPLDKKTIAESQMTGSLWGVAYGKNEQVLYTAAVLKGHIPLGPSGLDAIYTIDPFSDNPNATPWIELTDSLGIAVSSVSSQPQYLDNTTRELNLVVQNDAVAFQDVGKVGIGDIELSEDEETLYVVNLYDKTLYAISTSTKLLIGSYPIPDPLCTLGESRPWALAEKNGEIYIGVTCDGSGSGNPADLTDNSGATNLSATVYHLDGVSFVEVLSFPLDYSREEPFHYTGDCDVINSWKPWLSTAPAICTDGNIAYPTPLLTDIEFAVNGDMILGFTDRTGFQFGYANYGPTGTSLRSLYSGGDILKACKTDSGWEIENVASGCSSLGQAINTYDNDGYNVLSSNILGKEGEFFGGDYFHDNGGIDGNGLSYFPGHPEIATGGLALIPGVGEVITTSYDPVTGGSNFNTGGVIFLDLNTGQRSRNGYEIYRTEASNTTLGKGIGLGDLEALCDLAPIQIGNYVWIDANGDGIQDPCEDPLTNVKVKLYTKPSGGGNAELLDSTVTSVTGEYYFLDSLTKDSSYYVVFCGESYDDALNVLLVNGAEYALTAEHTGMGMNPDYNDSDATVIAIPGIGSLPAICVTVDSIDHSLDVGFVPKPTLDIVSTHIMCGQEADGGTLEVSVIGGIAPYVYDWNDDNYDGDSLLLNTPVGTYIITLTDATGFTIIDSASIIIEPCAPDPCDGADPIGGTVFNDINADGSQDSESGPEGVRVDLFVCGVNSNSELIETVYTDVNGDYHFNDPSITFGTGERYRVEFSSLPDGFTSSIEGTDNGTETQYVTMQSCDIDYGIINSNQYCQENPFMVTPCYVSSPSDNEDVLIRFSYANEGTTPLDKKTIAESQMTGSLWGVAYGKNERVLYTAAVLKGHIPLGPSGLDAIYTIDPFSDNPNATPWIELTDSLGIAVSSVMSQPQYFDNASRELNLVVQNDAAAFQDVGKVGLGDIELSEDEETLYVVNLYDKTLYAISTSTKLLIGSYPIPDPLCTLGESRPWALAEKDGEIYIGVTCDGSGSGNPADLTDNSGATNLSATVYHLDGASFVEVLSFPLDYPREEPFHYTGDCDVINSWKPWLSTAPAICTDGNIAYPTPLLTDIEFAANGDMILGFTDRTGFQFGYANYGPTGTSLRSLYSGGDILKACKTDSGWGIENVASGCSSLGQAIDTYDNDGYNVLSSNVLGKEGEFFVGDYFHDNGGIDGNGLSYFPGHPEITTGGLALIPGVDEVITTSYDPVTGGGNFNTGGVIFLDLNTGQRSRNGYEIYRTSASNTTLGKGIGLGDLEALCDLAPIQIGNYVWIDANGDGIQDPCEAPVANLTVKLFTKPSNGGTAELAATTMTDAEGEYYFTDSLTAGEAWETGFEKVKKDSTYFVVFCGDSYNEETNTIVQGDNIFELTLTNTGMGINPDFNDSDAAELDITDVGMFPAICVTADSINHTLDVGLIAKPDVAIIQVLDPDYDLTGLSIGDSVKFKIIVFNQGQGEIDSFMVIDYVPDGFTFDPMIAGNSEWTTTVTGEPVAVIRGLLEGGAKDSLCIYLTLGAYDEPSDLVNIVEISNAYTAGGPIEDCDSPLNQDPNDNGGSQIGTPADDYILGDGSATGPDGVASTDQDNVDPATIPICDLALINVVDAIPETLSVGDTVKYAVIIENQGTVSASNIDVIYTIPNGLLFLPINTTDDDMWTPVTTGATATYTDTLVSGQKDTLCIYLAVQNVSADDVVQDSTWTTFAEITAFEDPMDPGISKLDVDSTPDSDPTNDPGGNPDDETDDETDGSGAGDPTNPIEDTDPILDEDDHDPAKIEVCDIAAIIYTDNTGPFEYGDTVKFNVVVYNQGNDTITNVNIDNDLGTGLVYSASTQNTIQGWNGGGDSLRAISTENIAPGETDTICLYLAVQSTSTYMADDYLQFIEVVSFEDTDKPGTFKEDIDSTPDSDPTNDPGGNPNGPTDNILDGDGSGDPSVPSEDMDPTKDEDDSDPVIIKIFDLALDKKLLGTKTSFAIGDTATFAISIHNQGTDTAYSYTVVDYLNRGFSLSGMNNAGWTNHTDSATYAHTMILLPGATFVKNIELIVELPAPPVTVMDYWNYAEIAIADNNTNPGDIAPIDADSNPDDDRGNDNNVTPDSSEDNEITENGKKGNDEDDHDVAALSVGYDLALKKVIATDGPYNYGDTLDFTITVYNQGGQTVTNIAVYDTLPCGLAFLPLSNTGWDFADNKAYDTIPGPIVNGDSVAVTLKLLVQECAMLSVLNHYNVAEISDFADSDGNPPATEDIDSTPDNDPNNDGDDPVDDEVDIVGLEDEDDHDFAIVEFCDLAVTNVIVSDAGDPQVGDTVKFVVKLYNQGNTNATAVQLGYDIPEGLSYLPVNSAQSPVWTSVNDSLATVTFAYMDILAPGDIDSVCIYLLLGQPTLEEVDADSWTTIVEIQSFQDENGVEKTEDVDSTPDTDFGNDPGGNPDNETDNEIGGDGSGDPNNPVEDMDPTKDEDDHDPAKVDICDEAITIDTEDEGPHSYGDTVKYTVTLYNQGNGNTTNTTILNTVGDGLDYVSTAGNDAAGWTENVDGNLVLTVTDVLEPGDSISICLEMVIQMVEMPDEEAWNQVVEITQFEDPELPGLPKKDFDSTPDSDPTNDPGGNPGDETDDQTDGDGTGNPMDPTEDMDPTKDEDDHDPEQIKICDLAVTNEIAEIPESPKVGDTVKFIVRLYNQGNTSVTDVTLGYEIPEGYDYLPLNGTQVPQWTSANDSLAMVTFASASTLAPGDIDSVCIYLTLAQPSLEEIDEDSWTTVVEIQHFSDEDGIDKTEDVDSTPDTDFDNDAGGNPDDDTDNEVGGDGSGDPTDPTDDMDPTKDEDDHDPAKVDICDEALTISTEDDGPYNYGDTVKYSVTIYNQGNGQTTNTDVLNTVGDGLVYVPTAGNIAAGWDVLANGNLMVTSGETLAPGDSISICLELVIEMDGTPTDMSWTQVAEITEFEDPADPGEPKEDFDSTPDSDPTNDPGGNPDDDTDDETDGDGTGDPMNPMEDIDPEKDEDDHDPVQLEICDLALTNELAEIIESPKVGDTIKYNINVTNQGNQSARNIDIGYSIPPGLKYIPSNGVLTPAWTSTTEDLATVSLATTDTLLAGDKTTVCIFLEVTDVPVDVADVSIWTTLAEIQAFAGEDGVDKEDIDSTPDDDFTNDPGGNPDDNTDNVVDGDGSGDPMDPVDDMDPTKDEDDHDPADIFVCDAALSIATEDEGPHFYGDTVKYVVTIYNQGNGDIANVAFQDIIKLGQQYVSTANNDTSGWTKVNDGLLTNIYENIIGPGDSATICLELVVEPTEIPAEENYTQIAEIISFEDPDNPGVNKGDVDSTPDSDPDNDAGGNLEDETDNQVNGIGTGDPDIPSEDMDPTMDEDDHDGVGIKIYDIAIVHQKTFPDSIYDFGDIIELDVIICNQSNDVVTDIKIVDYVPLALDANIIENADWDLSTLPIASYIIADNMAPGASDTIKVYGVFQIDGTSDIEDFVSRVEVCRFEDELGNGTDATGPNGGIRDADSTPDQEETNDAGGSPLTTSDDVKGGNGLMGGGVFLDEDPLTDEDDHDPAILGAVDIAITIAAVDTITPALVGDTVVFQIDVFNQGTFDLKNVKIVCYVPRGFEMIDPNWASTSGDSIYTYTTIDVIPFADDDSIQVTLQVDREATVKNMTICAEVVSFTDDQGTDFTMFDIDSRADMDPSNDPGGIVYTLSDDAKDGTGTGMPGDDSPVTDEDDHDCAVPPILDLALIKTIVDPKPAVPGDSITYMITVINQGNIDAMDIKIIDLIPSGLTLADSDWTLIDDNNASYDIAQTIARDEMVMVAITFTINSGATTDDLLNVAEIENVFNVAGLNIDAADIDSRPADDNGADATAVFTSEDDNAGTNGFLGESPDDSDPAAVPVFDLALRKVLTNGPVAAVGTILDFDITIFNQGNMDAIGISVVDYIPAGMEFDDSSIADGWSTSGDNAIITIADTLKAGAEITISVSLMVTDASDPLELVSVAEIYHVDTGIDKEGMSYANPADIDSEADIINQDLGSEPYSDLDDIITQNGRNGGDEDDNDQAYPLLCQSMACTGRANLILNENCTTVITPEVLLRGNPYPSKFYDITIKDEQGREHANAFDKTDDGQEFTISIFNSFCDNQCWGIVRIENKNVPKPDGSTITTMCGAPLAQFMKLEDVAQTLDNGCNLPVIDLTEELYESGDKCQDETRIRVVRGTIELDGKIQKIILRRDTIITVPLKTDMITCPGSMDLIDAKQLECADLNGAYPTPEIVGKLMGERMAYPFVDKGASIDSTLIETTIPKDSTTRDKVLLENGTWAIFDIVIKYDKDTSYYQYDTMDAWIAIKDNTPICNLTAKYEDETYEGCVGAVSKIKRTWKVLDWCGGELKECVQWLIITDTSTPILELTKSFDEIDVAPWICAGAVDLSQYIKKAEACADVSIEYSASNGVLKGTVLSSLWLAESPVSVIITAHNDCGNSVSETLMLTLADRTAPVAIALDQINVSLTKDDTHDGGIAKVNAESIDAGSHDSGCGEVTTCILKKEELEAPLLYTGYWATSADASKLEQLYEATGTQLMVDGQLVYHSFSCAPDGFIYTYKTAKGIVTVVGEIPYVICSDYVRFCCGDIGINQVALIVQDESPYSPNGISWTNVNVEDKSVGKWYCVDESIPCSYVNGWQPKTTAQFGSDFCDSYEIKEVERTDNVSTCGMGSVTITWGAYDDEGDLVSTNDCIYNLSGLSLFDPYEIKWPKHYDGRTVDGYVRECEDVTISVNGTNKIYRGIVDRQDDIAMGDMQACSVAEDTGAPVWCNTSCGLIGSSYNIDTAFASDACYKIIKRWTVIDWCTWEANGSDIDDENDSIDRFEAVDDAWLRINENLTNTYTSQRSDLTNVNSVDITGHLLSNGYYNRKAGYRAADGNVVPYAACQECEKVAGVVDDVYFRYTTVDEDGYYTYDQVIKIVDDSEPIIEVAASDTVFISAGANAKGENYDNCNGDKIIIAIATDFCGVDTEIEGQLLRWWIEVRDADNNLIDEPVTQVGPNAEVNAGTGTIGDIHTIIWNITDGCGNTSSKKTIVYFVDHKNPTPVCIQDLSTANMNTDGTVSIWAADFDIGSFDNCGAVTVAFLVDADGNITEDEDAGDFVPSATFDCDDLTAGQSGTIDLRMYVIDDYGNTDFCNVRLRIDDNADVCPDGDIEAALIAGELRTEGGDMIESAEVNLTGGNSKTMSTPVDGQYTFDQNTMGRDYEVVPQKNGDYLNGVSTIDLVKIQRHILGTENLDSPYKMIAADVSNDQRISAIDLIHLRKMLLGIESEFSNNTSWRFVDAGQEFDNASSPWPFTEVVDINNLTSNRRGEDFIGVKIGDVSGNAIANSAVKADGRSANVIELKSVDQAVKKGDVVELSISSDNFDKIVGLQYTMNIEGLKYAGIESGAIEITADQVALLDANTVTTAWHVTSAQELTSKTLFTMYFEATADVVLSEAVSISSRVTAVGAYNVAADESDVKLTWEDEFSLIGGMELMQNQPNPFRKATDISFVLPQAGNATLTILDVTGKIIMTQEGEYVSGQNTITISKEELGVGSGVLYYQLESNEEVATMKMIVVE